jgi:hypothetical protein
MSTLSVAIIGTGNIAGGFDKNKTVDDSGIYSHAGAYKIHGRFEIKTIFDTDSVKASQFKKDWDVENVCHDMNEIVSSFHDVISICTPDNTHFAILNELLKRKCCKTIFIEKPISHKLEEIEQLISKAEALDVSIVVNFQRRFETEYLKLKETIEQNPAELLSVSCAYMKGLHHIGITMLDTLTMLCGLPSAVLAFSRVLNTEIQEYTYEFILFYDNFSVVVKTIDSDRFKYCYHIFEQDFLFKNKRFSIVDNSQRAKTTPLADYVYSGVKVLKESDSILQDTNYKRSMVDAINYISDLTSGKIKHSINTLNDSFNNLLIINKIIESHDLGLVKINFGKTLWKK